MGFHKPFQYAHVHNVKFLADDNVIKKFINCNPEYFETYVVLGQYYKDQHQTEIALRYFSKALTKEITTVQDKEAIEKNIQEIKAIH